MTGRWWIRLVSVPWFLAASWAVADAPVPLKIGVLTDMNGPYADAAGEGSVAAARLAVEDFGPTVFGRPIEIVAADIRTSPMSAPQSRGAGLTARVWKWLPI